MKSKRGQFYIISAILIAAVFVTLAANQNSVGLKRDVSEFYFLADEVYHEAGRVINYDFYNNQDNLEDFLNETTKYILSKNPDVEFVVIYSNKTINSEILFINCMKEEANLSSNNILGNQCSSNGFNDSAKINFDSSELSINLHLEESDQTYNIDLNNGKTLYMLFREIEGDETNVIEKKI